MVNNCEQLNKDLAYAEAELAKWEESEHPTIIEQCLSRVDKARQALFDCQGYINDHH